MAPTDRKLQQLTEELASLPPGQGRVVMALMADDSTYPELADQLGIHLGTVHTHLRRVRERYPALYAALMARRRWHLQRRHERAEANARAHNRRWFRKQANRRFFMSHGYWPWER